jgi:lysozyme
MFFKKILFFLFSFFFINTLVQARPIPIQLNDKGLEVAIVQKLLRNAGYGILATGNFDASTENCVRSFQEKQQLTAHGRVEDSTWNTLVSNPFTQTPRLIKGIDISHYENESYKGGQLPWEKIKENDIEFCYIKGTHGAVRRDEWFDFNKSTLENEHLLWGAYHFFSLLDDDIDQQINNFLSLPIDYKQKGVLPPVLDVEEDSRKFDKANMILNQSLISVRISIWLHTVEAVTGRKPMIYVRKSFWENVIGNPTGFENYLLWVAHYTDDECPRVPATWENRWSLWQYTDRGLLKGAGKFDLNYFKGSFAALLTMAGF